MLVMDLFDSRQFEKVLEMKLRGINIKRLMFICIGTNENIADSIGPCIGSELKKKFGKRVVGDKKRNIKSYEDLIHIKNEINESTVIAIDAAIAQSKIGEEVFINNKPIVMGSALGQNKGIIGDVNIKIAVKDLKINNKIYIKNYAKRISKSILKCLVNNNLCFLEQKEGIM